MQDPTVTPSRKKFLIWGAALLSSVTAFSLITGSKKIAFPEDGGKKVMVKMLTQDGTLVEVDADRISCGKRKKISDEQLKNWVVKKS